MKKTVLSALIILLLPIQVSAFTDLPTTGRESTAYIKAGYEYKTSIEWMTQNGVVEGYSDGTFRPDNCVNRAEFLKMLFIANETLQSTTANNPFPDVDEEAWYFPYVNTSFENKVIEGYPDGTFRPSECVNRVEAIKMAIMEFDLLDENITDNTGISFSDINQNAWYYKYIRSALAQKLLGMRHVDSALDSAVYFPGDGIARAEVAELLYRIKAVDDNGGIYNYLLKPNNIVNQSDSNPYIGEENAPIVMIEFSDYQCPFCKLFHDGTLELIKEKYITTGKLKLVYRDFPLNFHINALNASLAANCALEQGGNETFLAYHDLLYSEGTLTSEDLVNHAEDLDLDTEQFSSCLYKQKYLEEVNNDIEDGKLFGVGGTPSFFINGNPIEGNRPYEVFEAAIEKELQLQKPKAGEKIAIIETDFGTIKLKLFTDQVPEMTKNFEELTKGGKYNGVPFHRVIKNFIIQTGDFTNMNGTGGHSYLGEGTQLPDEFVPNLKHLYGTVSMANAGPDTNGSQFFIVTSRDGTPFLDGSYTVFGQVYQGMEVAERIQNLELSEAEKPSEEINMLNVEVTSY